MSGEDVVDIAAERLAARVKRKAFASSPVSAFVRVMRACMNAYLKARSEGVSREDGIQGIEAELRGAWPKGVSRFTPACQACDDTGWEEYTCVGMPPSCGRKGPHKAAHEGHAYVMPCHCAKGETHRKRIATVEDEIARAGRMAKKKPRGFTRMGA